MTKKEQGKGATMGVSLFISAVLLMALTFHSCENDEMFYESENIELKSSVISEIYLDYPEDAVAAGENFDITFYSTCGRIMIERGFTGDVDEYGVINNKVYTGLTCDTENLLWEAVGLDEFETCEGATITENLTEPGTYVYRAKLNLKAKNKSGCTNCKDFAGNKYECFTITVAEGGGNENTFTDARDGKVYNWVQIGTQIWMAENLSYNLAGSRAYNDDEAKAAIYGRLYTWGQANEGGACPAGWHVPSMAEWETLISYIETNSAVYGNVAKALASQDYWTEWFLPTYPFPGSNPALNNSSGFNARPAGWYSYAWNAYDGETFRTEFWSSDPGDFLEELPNYVGIIWDVDHVFTALGSPNDGLSIRCIKNAE